MAFEAVAVTGVHTTVGRNRKLRFRSCSSAVAFYCSLSVALPDTEHFSAGLVFAVQQRYVYGSHCTLGGEGGIPLLMVPVFMLTLNIAPFCGNICCAPLRYVVQPSCIDIIIIIIIVTTIIITFAILRVLSLKLVVFHVGVKTGLGWLRIGRGGGRL
jgi:hypothetical protein